MRFRYYFTVFRLLLIVIIPVILLILPATFFDTGRSMCLSKLIFDFECYGCGMSRACMHLIHFDFEEAYAYNMLSFIVFPMLAIIWVQWFLKEWKLYKRYRAAFAVSHPSSAERSSL